MEHRPRTKRRRLSILQIITHLAVWVPLGVLVFDFLNDNLTANPIQAAQQRTGDTALILLILSLACTPINMLFRLPALLRLRRTLGLYGYMYAAIHLLLFVGLDYAFNFNQILRDVGDKRYILVGLTAFLLLSALAFTSFDYWKVRLGKAWKRLHRLVYLINLLVVLHFAWAIKGDFLRLQGDVFRPLLAALVVTVLLALRIPSVRRKLAGRLQIRRPLKETKPIAEHSRTTGD
jgi:sulfoxide reductase heme-binding subunit YedZ